MVHLLYEQAETEPAEVVADINTAFVFDCGRSVRVQAAASYSFKGLPVINFGLWDTGKHVRMRFFIRTYLRTHPN